MHCTVRLPDRFHLDDDKSAATGAAPIQPEAAVGESRKFGSCLPFWA